MRPLVVLLAGASILMAAPATGASPTPSASEFAPLQIGDGVEQSPEEALAQDLGLVAKAKGWTVEEAAADHHAAERIGQIAERVAKERPSAYVGAALSEQPRGAPTLYIKGPADQFIQDLVRASDIEVVIADNQPFSFDELETRKLRVHHALEALGFRYVATSVNITGGGVIPAGVTLETGLPSRVEDVLAALPADVRSSVELTINDAPIVTDDWAFGGMWVLDGGVNECTSGWSVKSRVDFSWGITTAGHCRGIDQVNHPGHGLHDLTFKNQHEGQWGDIEWHWSNVLEPDDFYADAVTIRDVFNVEPRANIAVNEPVCLYGRSTNFRNCTLEVQDVSQACTNEGVFNDRLVMMNGVAGKGGDSGGGWSFGGTAFGSHKGRCGPDFVDRSVWSVADLFDEALSVDVTH